jgi:hypothetical protein
MRTIYMVIWFSSQTKNKENARAFMSESRARDYARELTKSNTNPYVRYEIETMDLVV